MGKTILVIFMTVFWGAGALAQALIPATSEDLNDFDRQVQQQVQKRLESQKAAKKTTKGAAFGAAVAEEAKLVQSTATTKRKNSTGSQQAVEARERGGAQVGGNANAGSASGNSAKDGKVSSPSTNSRGNSANAPGKNK